jgi:hypothetical protein
MTFDDVRRILLVRLVLLAHLVRPDEATATAIGA